MDGSLYFRVLCTLLFWAVSLGIGIPTLVSLPSTLAVFVGIVWLCLVPVGSYYLLKPVVHFLEEIWDVKHGREPFWENAKKDEESKQLDLDFD